MRMGAFAALLGLTLTQEGDRSDAGHWRSIAVGDSCLIQVRDKKILSRFPINRVEEFDSRPCLLGTNGDEITPLEMSGHWQSGDVFLLLTDALAAWFYRLWDLPDTDPLAHLAVETPEEFQALVDQQRRDTLEDVPMLKNDDATIVICEMR